MYPQRVFSNQAWCTDWSFSYSIYYIKKKWILLSVVDLNLGPRHDRQTLGGSSGNPSPAPVKGGALHKTRSAKNTLKKMKPYGGALFYDK